MNRRAWQRNKRVLAGSNQWVRALSYDVGGSYHSIPSLRTGRRCWAAEMLTVMLCCVLCLLCLFDMMCERADGVSSQIGAVVGGGTKPLGRIPIPTSYDYEK